MKASIIAVGTELLFGQTVNTNAAYLSEKLNLLGFDVMYHFVVGDNPQRLEDKLDEAFSSCDLVLLTGGLGPTQDDLTKETVAEKMGVNLVQDQHVLDDLAKFFELRHGKVSKNNYKQAYLPEGCIPFYNAAGTAPGFALEKNGKIAICLPGPPREMIWLYENCVSQYLEKITNKKMYYKVIRTIGIGESDLETILLPLIDGQTDPTIATYAKEGECSFRIASQRHTIEEAMSAVDEMIQDVDKLVGKYIFSYDNEDINEVVVRLLKEKNLKLSAAESCTGGLFAASITDVPGASDVFLGSYVTYSNSLKVGALGINPSQIDEYGVSSPEIALEMARNSRARTGADIAISITGNAGPVCYEGQAVGQAYIGVSYLDKESYIEVKPLGYGDRKWIRNYFRLYMLKTVYSIINSEF